MGQVLAQRAPQLLNGVEPGDGGRQRQDLDRQSEAGLAPGSGRAGRVRPVGRQAQRPARALRLLGEPHFGMNVYGPVVLDHVQAFCVRIGRPQVLIDLAQRCQSDRVSPSVDHPPGQRIEGSDQMDRGVARIAEPRFGLLAAACAPGAGQRGLALDGDLVEREGDDLAGSGAGLGQDRRTVGELRIIVGVGAEEGGAGTPSEHAEAIEQPVGTGLRQALSPECRQQQESIGPPRPKRLIAAQCRA